MQTYNYRIRWVEAERFKIQGHLWLPKEFKANLLKPGKASNVSTRLHLVELLAKGVLWRSPPPKKPSLMLGQRVTLHRHQVPTVKVKKSSQLIECGEFNLVPAWSLHPYVLVYFVQEETLLATKMWISTQPQNLWLIICPACKMWWNSGGKELVGVANKCLTEALFTKGGP